MLRNSSYRATSKSKIVVDRMGISRNEAGVQGPPTPILMYTTRHPRGLEVGPKKGKITENSIR